MSIRLLDRRDDVERAARCIDGFQGYLVISLGLVAGLLLVAAGFKLHELVMLDAAPWLVVQVVGEWLLAMWLISGVAPRAVRLVTLGCFGIFAAVALWRALRGDASCGCFGLLTVNPWVTLTLDLVVLAMLAAWRPRDVGRVPGWRWVLVAVVGIGTVGGGVALARYWQPVTMDDEGMINTDGGFVLLEPGEWLGRRLPLLPHIEQAERLRAGRWIVLLYKHDCPACVRAAATFGSGATPYSDGRSFAVIEVPPYGKAGHLDPLAARGVPGFRLSDQYDWFVATPVYLLVDEGVVAGVQVQNEAMELIAGH